MREGHYTTRSNLVLAVHFCFIVNYFATIQVRFEAVGLIFSYNYIVISSVIAIHILLVLVIFTSVSIIN